MTGEPNYLDFGPYGPDFQDFFDHGWNLVSDGWHRLRLDPDLGLGLDFDAALNEELDRSGFLFKQSTQILRSGHVLESAFLDFWEDFRTIFSPPLADGRRLAAHYNSVTSAALLKVLSDVYNDDTLTIKKRDLNRVCYGPFRGDEMAWVIKNHPRLLEIGGGTGYTANRFLRGGADIISLDNNRYGQLTRGEAFPWTAKLLANGRLIIGGIDQLAQHVDDRALLISWPEPGSLFPAEALEVFAAAGGKVFLFKLGGFIGGAPGTTDPDYTPPKNPWENMFKFFRLLARDWREISDPSRPPFLVRYASNNLLVVEHRTA